MRRISVLLFALCVVVSVECAASDLPLSSDSTLSEDYEFSFDDSMTTLSSESEMEQADGVQVEAESVLEVLERMEILCARILEVLAFGIGLAIWRLVVLAKSQRNIF